MESSLLEKATCLPSFPGVAGGNSKIGLVGVSQVYIGAVG